MSRVPALRAGQEHVLRLDVPVHDPPRVGVGECVADLAGNPEGVVNPELVLARYAITQRLSLDERHDVVEVPAGRAGVVEREDMWMLQLRGGANLAQESIGADRGSDVGAQHLDRHESTVLEVAREVDGCHPATTKLPVDLIPVRKRCSQAVERVRHYELGRDPRC